MSRGHAAARRPQFLTAYNLQNAKVPITTTVHSALRGGGSSPTLHWSQVPLSPSADSSSQADYPREGQQLRLRAPSSLSVFLNSHPRSPELIPLQWRFSPRLSYHSTLRNNCPPSQRSRLLPSRSLSTLPRLSSSPWSLWRRSPASPPRQSMLRWRMRELTAGSPRGVRFVSACLAKAAWRMTRSISSR